MLNAFPARGARMSLMISDGTLHASAQHLLENFMRLAAAEAGTPTLYRPLSRDGLTRKEISAEKQPREGVNIK
jgi:hypothetical protein